MIIGDVTLLLEILNVLFVGDLLGLQQESHMSWCFSKKRLTLCMRDLGPILANFCCTESYIRVASPETYAGFPYSLLLEIPGGLVKSVCNGVIRSCAT